MRLLGPYGWKPAWIVRYEPACFLNSTSNKKAQPDGGAFLKTFYIMSSDTNLEKKDLD